MPATNEEQPGRTRPLSRPVVALLLISHVLAGTLLLPMYEYQLNPDGVAYIDSATKYARLDFAHAVTGHWPPLLSWLLVPFLLAGMPALTACKLLGLATGLVVSVTFLLFLHRWETGRAQVILLFIVCSTCCYYYAFSTITPDILFLALALLYTYVLTDESYPGNAAASVVCGILGSMLYLAKSFGLPFFIAHFTLSHLSFLYQHGRKRSVLRQYAAGIVSFLIISVPWISVQSIHAGRLTIGDSGSYAFKVNTPDGPVHPMNTAGLMPPPDPGAVSAWDDLPSGTFSGPQNSFERLNLWGRLRILRRNLELIPGILSDFSLFWPVFLAGGLLIAISERADPVERSESRILLLTQLLLVVGYATIVVRERYIWFVQVSMLILCSRIFDMSRRLPARYRKVSRLVSPLLVPVFAMSFLVMPVTVLDGYRHIQSNIPVIAGRLAAAGVSGRVAADENWCFNLYLAFHGGWQFYGVRGQVDSDTFREQLSSYRIDYVLVYGDSSPASWLPEGYREVRAPGLSGVRIYRLTGAGR